MKPKREQESSQKVVINKLQCRQLYICHESCPMSIHCSSGSE